MNTFKAYCYRLRVVCAVFVYGMVGSALCLGQPSGTIENIEEFCALNSIEFRFIPSADTVVANWLIDGLPADVVSQTDTTIVLSFNESNVYDVCAVAVSPNVIGDTICSSIGVLEPIGISEFELECNSTADSFQLIIPITGGHFPYTIFVGEGVIINDTIFTPYFLNGSSTEFVLRDLIGCTNQIFIDSLSCDCPSLELPDTTICQFPFDYIVPDSFRGGAWTSLSTQLTISSFGDSLVRFDATMPGDYDAVYSGSIGDCAFQDTLSITPADVPMVPIVTIDTFCNASRTHFQVSFTIVGGDPTTYMVNGVSLDDDRYLSDSIPSGESFLFIITDANGCGADTVQGEYTCACLSSIGELDVTPQHLCGRDTLFTANYYDPSGQIISGNDVRNYLLVSDTMAMASSLLQRNVDGRFHFDPANMVFGQAYFAVLVIGNGAGGDTVVLGDRCLLQSAFLPVIWYPSLDVTLDASSLEINCANPSVSLTLTSTSDLSWFSFIWRAEDGGLVRGDSTNQSLQVSDPGTYLVHVFHPLADCDTMMAITISEDPFIPMLEILSPDTLTCLDTVVTIIGENSSSGASILYSWEGPGILSDPTGQNILVSSAGTYILTLRDTSNDCVVLDSVQVVVDQEPPHVEAEALGGIGCTFETATVSGAGSDIGLSFSYSWSSLDSGSIISSSVVRDIEVDAPGRYRLRVQNVLNGCQDSIDVVVSPIDSMIRAFSVERQQVQCDTPFTGRIYVSFVEGGTPPFEYSIDGGANWSANRTFDQLGFGIYDVQVRDAAGCLANRQIVLAEPIQFNVDLGEDLFVPLGDDITLYAQSDLPDSLRKMYSWEPLYDTSRANRRDQVFMRPIGYYPASVTLTSINGCTAADDVNIYVYLDERIYVPNAIHPGGPQQDNRTFFIFSDPIMVSSIEDVHIFNRWGEQVFRHPIWPVTDEYMPGLGWDGLIDGEEAPTGVYVYYFDVQFVDGSRLREKGEFILLR